jgi:hypothetical protein
MNQRSDDYPTMIIPKGTEIKVNAQGKLSIKTPGNLILQNSGSYDHIASERGSVKVEPGVNVEAIEVSAADTCLIQGSLSAWRVRAKRLCLEEQAQAFIMLQESQEMDLAKTARLVGNFGSDKEIFLFLGRFAPQLKGLPAGLDVMESVPRLSEGPAPEPSRQPAQMALVLLEREFGARTYDPDSQQAIKEIIGAVKGGDPNRWRTILDLFSGQIKDPSPDLQKAFSLLREGR